MELPKNMKILCDFGGDILQKPDDLHIKSIFEIVEEQSLPMFHDYIKKIFENGDYVKVRPITLIDNNNYYISIEVLNMKISFSFYRCENNSFDRPKDNNFWMETIFKYEYYIKTYSGTLESISKLIEKLFYKNRSDLNEVISGLHNALEIEHSVLLFRNGHDHVMYCRNKNVSEECNFVKNDNYKYDDKKFNENVLININDIMIVKKYENTYIKDFINNDELKDKKVYVLKLAFGPMLIGYFEFIPYSYIMFTPTEIKLIQSLSNILAYIIHNKNEQLDIENYIIKKFK